MKKFWTSVVLVPSVSMLAVLSACGSSPEEKTDNDDSMDEYCASVDYAEEICEEAAASARSSASSKSAEQTGDADPETIERNTGAVEPGFL